MKLLIAIIFICAISNLHLSAQSIKKDSALIKKIDTMFSEDQFWRKEYMKIDKHEKSDYNETTIEAKWKTSDSINEIKAKVIINLYGYPGYDRVGQTSDNFWAIVQHCDDDIPFQEHVLALMKTEIAKNNASKSNYAYLVDRVLVNKHQKQIYAPRYGLIRLRVNRRHSR